MSMRVATGDEKSERKVSSPSRERHALGVLCGLAAGAWLGGAEAPIKVVTGSMSPFAVSLCMVAGVFVARWTFPTLLRGTGSIFGDLRAQPHLMVWAVLAGALWAVANTLTVFAIRDVGLGVAFPLWNANCLIGLLWGVVLFRELRGASLGNRLKVGGGAVGIVASAMVLGLSLMPDHGGASATGHALAGIVAALGASLLWGTMYVPYRKAYLSGMNPLSFVTVFTVGELGTMTVLAVTLGGGGHALGRELASNRGSLFWLFVGGFCWVIGDIFQQYATKFIGIGRGIPLSNTNQLWGLGWGALVFGELAGVSRAHVWQVVGGSVAMALSALAISTAAAGEGEERETEAAMLRESRHYGLEREVGGAGDDTRDHPGARDAQGGRVHAGRDGLIVILAVGIFLTLGWFAARPGVLFHGGWALGLSAVSVAMSMGVGWRLWSQTGFSESSGAGKRLPGETKETRVSKARHGAPRLSFAMDRDEDTGEAQGTEIRAVRSGFRAMAGSILRDVQFWIPASVLGLGILMLGLIRG